LSNGTRAVDPEEEDDDDEDAEEFEGGAEEDELAALAFALGRNHLVESLRQQS
jgi:hypothetical protein